MLYWWRVWLEFVPRLYQKMQPPSNKNLTVKFCKNISGRFDWTCSFHCEHAVYHRKTVVIARVELRRVVDDWVRIPQVENDKEEGKIRRTCALLGPNISSSSDRSCHSPVLSTARLTTCSIYRNLNTTRCEYLSIVDRCNLTFLIGIVVIVPSRGTVKGRMMESRSAPKLIGRMKMRERPNNRLLHHDNAAAYHPLTIRSFLVKNKFELGLSAVSARFGTLRLFTFPKN